MKFLFDSGKVYFSEFAIAPAAPDGAPPRRAICYKRILGRKPFCDLRNPQVPDVPEKEIAQRGPDEAAERPPKGVGMLINVG